jgi:hypothetical protein
VALLLKLAPFTVSINAAAPWVALAGFSAWMVGIVPAVAGMVECE